MHNEHDAFWMDQALELGRRGLGLCSPNPTVGSIIVRDGLVLGRGWHQGAGKPHAEREAIADAKRQGHDLRGATIYVTLEPCSTQGRTGACTEALVQEGLARVVYALRDPNPAHAGRADGLLRAAGIEVLSGVRQEAAEGLVRGFASVQQHGRPWVIAKTAMSLDGRITRPAGEGQWLTTERSRQRVQELRFEVDAIVTSGETVRQDNPKLTLRGEFAERGKKQPWRVILSGQEASAFRDFDLSQDEFTERNLFFQGNDLKLVLEKLAKKYDCNTILIESGGRLMASFLEQNLIDEMVIFYAPMVCGGDSYGVSGQGASCFAEGWGIEEVVMDHFGSDFYIRGFLRCKEKGSI